MKIIIVFFSCLFFETSFSQPSLCLHDSSLLIWQKRAVKTSDFVYKTKGLAKYNNEKTEGLYAQIVTSIKHCFYLKNDTVYFSVFSVMNTLESTTSIESLSKSDLKHEQLHFDITECFRRLCLKEALESNCQTETEVLNVLKRTAEKCDLFQSQYDKETKNGQDSSIQNNWNSKVTSLLKNTSEYYDLQFKIAKPEYKTIWKFIQ